MKGPDITADVLVIGGGPGGTTAATMLARKGWKVVLLEREHFPRDHIGESLLPATMPVLEELGVLPAMQEAGFLPKWGATMVWGKGPSPWSWYFRETNKRYPHSYQVWRPHFDQLLLQNSRAHGVDVREGYSVTEVLFEDGRATGACYFAEGSRAGVAHARFVVDVSGQSAILGRKLQLRRWDPLFRNLAVYGYFAGVRRLPAPDETNIFIESYPNGWFWSIPLHTGWMSVGAVVDSQRGQEEIRFRGVGDFLADQVRHAPHTAQMLQDARLAYGPFTAKDWSYVAGQLVGNGYILVGDAACFVDPLFSSGVHLATMAGVLAAAYVTTALKDATMQDAAGHVYEELYQREYEHFREMVRLFYSSNRTVDSYFWEVRRMLNSSRDLLPRHAFIRAVAGQPPQGYERAVLDRGQAPAEFVAGLRELELERAARQAKLRAMGADGGLKLLAVYRAIPRLAAGVTVQRKPVVAEGEFVWGNVLVTEGHPEGTPCSRLVAKMVSLIDGRASVPELIARVCEGVGESQRAGVERAALTALDILYVDGAIAQLNDS